MWWFLMPLFNCKKQGCRIETGYCSDGKTYGVTICNAIKADDCFDKIARIIRHYSAGEEFYFGFYRLDGLTLTKEEWNKCDVEIPLFFKKYGLFQEISETVYDKKGREKVFSGYLNVARAKINDDLYSNLQWIFQYYLETVMFVPKISFDRFEKIYSNYMKESTKYYLINGYTDFLYSYYDSGTFSIYFDPEEFDASEICEYVSSIFDSN